MIKKPSQTLRAEDIVEFDFIVLRDLKNVSYFLSIAQEKFGVWIDEKGGKGQVFDCRQEISEEGICAAVVPPNINLKDVLSKITIRSPYLIVADEDNNPLGVISWENLLQKLHYYLEVLETELDTVLDTVNEAVTIIDEEDIVAGWNRRAQEMYQIPPQNILGENIKKFFSSLVVTEVIKDGEVRDSYHQPCRGIHVLINASPLKLNEKNIGSVGAERDITETVYLYNELSRASSQVMLLEQKIKKNISSGEAFKKIHGHSKKLQKIISFARKVAITNATVLIEGESGTGKELFAEAIHLASPRKDKPFVIVNCGAIPASLFESELFGIKEGRPVGVDVNGKIGKFELANGGTILLDEIESMQLDMQVKLLGVLQSRKYYSIGAKEPSEVDVRVIAASNLELGRMVAEGLFREDLYYQLNVVTIDIPPLRERKDDLPELVYLFVQEFANYHHREIKKIDPELMSVFLNYPWPGNIRELRNVIERLVILAEDSSISKVNLPDSLQAVPVSNEITSSLNKLTEQTEKQVILQALKETGGNKSKTAKLLGIPRSTLYYKLKALNML
ncbi:sigma 54-interacting transcriptional regulator [Bacillota bacterium LX-D]|nr:sigma 54-interacting transcriptional regulator [Bacillota bacterium LX-D]